MNIIITSHPEDKAIQYKLTRGREREKLANAPEVVNVAAYAVYADLNKANGELLNLVSIMTPEGVVYCTNSPTFVDDFNAMIEAFPNCSQMKVLKLLSKKGRTFLACEPVI